MMGYRDPNEDTWEAEYWDEYLQDFGLAAYVEARYELSRSSDDKEGIQDGPLRPRR